VRHTHTRIREGEIGLLKRMEDHEFNSITSRVRGWIILGRGMKKIKEYEKKHGGVVRGKRTTRLKGGQRKVTGEEISRGSSFHDLP